ncbi:glycosyltransferase family protein [Pontibacter arcticus]|uniref:Glycosyl transferase family 2 n=1 Tax=Pontibacter arcticus TaxID=2080288 RepID=A0A364RBS2_9BACT|nr:hypothetical protein [Pontibacter arcticus]RAU81724.1 hypothetical protein DP923_13550 [Pontibacter arcticus]
MKISGFTMSRNGDKLYYPVKESVCSILPLVDEFVVALGDSDEDDKTRELLESIGSDKIKVYDRVWSEQSFVEGQIFAEETNFALSKCSGNWCFYLQADEVIHEQDFGMILSACQIELDNPLVDGFLFKYHHFWGDYDHYLPFYGWYRNEIRIVRNKVGIYSYKDAQSFRKGNSEKLSVKEIDAHVYHYGWVRPPRLMQVKKKEQDSMHHGIEKIEQEHRLWANEFDFGALGNIPVFKGTHPKVMHECIQRLNWKNKLNFSKKADLKRPKVKHEKLKYRLISFFENNLNGGKSIIGYSNWNKV